MLFVCVLVAELGDYDEVEHGSSEYVLRCKMLPKQTEGHHGVIADIHRTLT